MTPVLDPEEPRRRAAAGELRGRHVLELGCGDGRLTLGIAANAAGVLAFDPDVAAVERARRTLPPGVAGRVVYEAASGRKIEFEPRSFDVAVFSWSL